MTIVNPAIAHVRDIVYRESLENEIVLDRLGTAFAEFDCRVFVVHFSLVGIATNRKFGLARRIQVGDLSVKNTLGFVIQLHGAGGEENPVERAFRLMVVEINYGVCPRR